MRVNPTILVRATATATLLAIGVALVAWPRVRDRVRAEKPGAAPRARVAMPPAGVAPAGKRSPEAELEQTIARLIAADPCRTMDLIAELPEEMRRDDIACDAAARWARVEPHGVLAWLQETADEHLKPRLIAAVGFELAQTNPAGAIATTQRLVEGHERRLLLVSIAEAWASMDPQGAAGWAARLPSEPTSDLLRWSVARGAMIGSRGAPVGRERATAP